MEGNSNWHPTDLYSIYLSDEIILNGQLVTSGVEYWHWWIVILGLWENGRILALARNVLTTFCLFAAKQKKWFWKQREWHLFFLFLLIWTLPYLPLCSFLSWNGFTPLESMSHTRQTCKLLVSGHVHACKQTLICWWFENIANFEIYQPPCAPFLPSVITW